MKDSSPTTDGIYLERAEKTVLVDAFRWYLDEHTLPESNAQNVESAMEHLEETQCLDLDLVDGNLVQETLLTEFGLALKPHIRELEDAESVGDFYRTQFENINEKLEDHNKEQNPFY